MTKSPFKMTCIIWLSGVLATSHVFFNPSKSTHVSFNQKFLHYITSEVANPTNTTHSHKDLRVIISDSLNWNIHHDAILSKAYRTLGLV